MREVPLDQVSGYIGNFSYILVYCQGQPENNIVISYAPLRLGGPSGLVWIGGECGNNMEWIARGMTPAEAFEEIQARIAAMSEDGAGGHSEIVVPYSSEACWQPGPSP